MIGTRLRGRRAAAQAGARRADPRGPAVERRVRILWLIKGLGRGGAEILLLQAARLRDRRRFDCEAGYLLGSRGWLADDLRAEGVPVHLFPSERHTDVRWALRLRRHLRRDPVDIVHVHSPLVAAVARVVVRSLPKSVRPATISTEHLPWTGHARSTRLANRLTFSMDEGHLAVSGDVRESIPRRLRRNVRVLRHGVPVADIRRRSLDRDAVRRELGIAQGEIAVCTVANVTEQKGYPELFAAARTLLDRGHAARFVIAGRGTQDRQMRHLTGRYRIEDRVIALGPVEDPARLMAASDIFVLASHWEGLPLVLMEAMSVGVPIVATKVGGVPEIVREGIDGILVPDRRPDLLAEAVERLMVDSELRRRLGRAGAKGAIRFDDQAAIRTIEDFYLEIVRRRRSRVPKRAARAH